MLSGRWLITYKQNNTGKDRFWCWTAIDDHELYCFKGSKYASIGSAKRGWKHIARRLGIDRYQERIATFEEI